MNANNFWQVFLDTGSPEIYLLYSKAKKMEDLHVLDDQGLDPAGYKLQ